MIFTWLTLVGVVLMLIASQKTCRELREQCQANGEILRMSRENRIDAEAKLAAMTADRDNWRDMAKAINAAWRTAGHVALDSRNKFHAKIVDLEYGEDE